MADLEEVGLTGEETPITLAGTTQHLPAMGNINFGFVTESMGRDPTLVSMFAGAVSMREAIGSGEFRPWWINFLGEKPEDYADIEGGRALARQRAQGNPLTEEMLVAALGQGDRLEAWSTQMEEEWQNHPWGTVGRWFDREMWRGPGFSEGAGFDNSNGSGGGGAGFGGFPNWLFPEGQPPMVGLDPDIGGTGGLLQMLGDQFLGGDSGGLLSWLLPEGQSPMTGLGGSADALVPEFQSLKDQVLGLTEQPATVDLETNAPETEKEMVLLTTAADAAMKDRQATLTYYVNTVVGGSSVGGDKGSVGGGGSNEQKDSSPYDGGEKKGDGIPKYAEGGTVPYTGLALVGEEGPELVTLPGGADVIPSRTVEALMPNLSRGGDTITNNLYITIEGVTDAESLVRELRRELRAQGLDFSEVR